jgi:putative colanic acid biosynthesis acetyltransferase WcaF
VHVYPSSTIYFPWNLEIGDYSSIGEHVYVYNLGKVKIGRQVTLSLRAHLCAGSHDYQDPAMPLLKPPITIEDQAWICADAFVGPGCTVKEGAVVAARAVVTGDVEPWTVVGGNPAKLIKRRELKRVAQVDS